MSKTFGHDSTTDEVLEGVDLTGKRVLVTGAPPTIAGSLVQMTTTVKPDLSGRMA